MSPISDAKAPWEAAANSAAGQITHTVRAGIE